MKYRPPSLPDRFLRWFCRKDLLEFILGDLYELYIERLEEKGKRRADLAFFWDVLRFCRPSNFRINNTFTHTIMVKNYMKVGFRSLRKNWINSLINVSGLSLSVGCAVTTFLFADFFFNLNSIHSQKERIYQVVSHLNENNEDVLYGPSPMIMADRISQDLPQVDQAVRVQYKRGNVKVDNKVFRELVQFADPDFLELFDFPLLSGEKSALDNNKVFISEQMSEKYFGDKPPKGERIDFKFGDQKMSFEVGGVFGKVPANTTFRPGILLNLDTYLKIEPAHINWIDEAKATFISLKEGVTPEDITQSLIDYKKVQNEANAHQAVEAFELISFQELSRRPEIQDTIVQGNTGSATIAIAFTGFLLIVFACLNYVNIAIASATTRLKEIGVRKVMGGSRKGIAQQFLVENFLICAFAMIFGVLLCYFLLLPAFNWLLPVVIPFSFSSYQTAVLYFIGLFLFLGLLSGGYPAFYISRFQVLKIFKGERSLGGKNYFSRVLLTGQFTLAFMTVLGCFIFTDNATYVKQVSWGYDPKGILSLPIGEYNVLELLKEEAEKNPAIADISTSQGQLGVDNSLVSFENLGAPFKVMTYDVEPGYLNLMNVPLNSGRFFQEKGKDDQSIVVNELFVKQMGWSDPLGRSIQFQGKRRTVIGVVADVYHVFFSADIQRPMVFTSGDAQPNFLVIKAAEEKLVEVDDYLGEKWQEIAPFDPYVSFYQADSFDRGYQNVDSNIWFMMALSVLTIFLSCLGLYGLLAFTLQNRIKEFSIRKVLGASPMNIIRTANKEFVWILLISFGLGVPLGIWSIDGIAKSLFSVSKPLSWVPIVTGLLVTLTTILISVFAQIRKVIRVNPSTILKGE